MRSRGRAARRARREGPDGKVAGSSTEAPAVNLVSLLEGLCKPLGRNVLISGAVAAETSMALMPLGEHQLRGIVGPCSVFTLAES